MEAKKITVSGTCKHCGKEFTDYCFDLTGMMEDPTEATCCYECAIASA